MTPQRSHCNIAHKRPNLFPLLFCFFSFLLSAITVDNDLSRKHGKNSKILQKINLLLKYSCVSAVLICMEGKNPIFVGVYDC